MQCLISRQKRIIDAAKRNARRIFILGIACSAFYVVFSLIYHLFLNPEMFGDLRGTWLPAVDSYIYDINNLYDNINCPFKNLPQIVFYLMIFYFIPGDLLIKILAFGVSIFVMSMCTFVVARKNYQLMGQDATKALILASLGLMMIAQSVDQIYSQLNISSGLCLVLSFYGMLKGNEKLQFFFLGLSVMFKHITIFMIPILLIQGKFSLRKLVTRLVFVVLPLVPSIVIFLRFPHLIPSFIKANTNAIVDFNNSIIFAGSLTKFLTLYTPLSPIVALVVVAVVGYGAFILLAKKRHLDNQDYYIIASFVTMLISPEFYGQHHGIFYFFIVMWLIKYSKRYLRVKVILVALISTILVIPLSSVFFLVLYVLEKMREPPVNPAPVIRPESPAIAAEHT